MVNIVNVLLQLILSHVLAVLFYKWLKKHDLIKAMITGNKEIVGQLPLLKFAGVVQFMIVVALVVVIMIVNI